MKLDNKTLKMFATLCKIANTNNPVVLKAKSELAAKGWTFVAAAEETANGNYDSFAMVNEQTKQVLVVNAGANAANDLGSVLQVLSKTTPPSFSDTGITFLDSLLDTYKDYSFINTGHSLGAVYAQLSQAYLESKGTKSTTHVFESMGSADVVKHFIEEQELKNVTIETVAANSSVYNAGSSFISSQLNNQLGCVYTLPKEKVVGIAGLLGKIAGIKGADKLFDSVDSALSSFKVHEIEYIIPKLNDKTELTLVKCYDGTPYEDKGENLVGEAINDIAKLFDFA
jgi:hypothetical protein